MSEILNPCIDCRKHPAKYGLKLVCTAGLSSQFSSYDIFEQKFRCCWICEDCAPLWKRLMKHLRKADIAICKLTESDRRWMYYIDKEKDE